MEKILNMIWPEKDFEIDQDVTVLCPFHDDTIGSMQVKLLDNNRVLYHCKACDKGGNGINLVANYFRTDDKSAMDVINAVTSSTATIGDWKNEKVRDIKNEQFDLLTKFGIEKWALIKSDAGSVGSGISFPITIGDAIVDIRTYVESRSPKVKSVFGAKSGYLWPAWVDRVPGDRVVIAEGEKDALTLLSHKIKAYSITGGCHAVPKMNPYLLQDKEVFIVYDNDDAGKEGAEKLASWILENEKLNTRVRIAAIGPLVNEKDKGDVNDYFHEFRGSKEGFLKMLENAKVVTRETLASSSKGRLKPKQVKLDQADSHTGKWLMSTVQVSATTDSSYTIPESMKIHVTNDSDDGIWDAHPELQRFYKWSFDKLNNIEDVLKLVVDGNDMTMARLVVGVKGAKMTVEASEKRIPIYSALVSSTSADTAGTGKQATEHSAYVIGTPMDAGKEYDVVYKIIPNEEDGNKSMMLIATHEDQTLLTKEFKITQSIKDTIDKVSALSFEQLIENAKGWVNADFNEKLITVSELTYNSVLQFNMGRYAGLKGCIDSIIVTDTGFGKSITAERLMNAYGVGARVSLVGSASTPQGLIGGSKIVGRGLQTTAGIIPRNHRGLIMFEELGKNKSDILKELTDIRTSGKAEIARVSGKISLPAIIRMLFSSNPKSDSSGTNKTVDSYANGIEIIQDLLGAREDIGRFDLIAILGQSESTTENPFWQPVKHLTKEDMENKINWIWSRKENEIIFEDNTIEEIMRYQKALNHDLESDVQIFGRKTWLKLAKLSAAIAAYRCSHSPDYRNIVVKKEHIEKAYQLFRILFDNSTFRLREHVAQERAYSRMDEGSTEMMRQINRNRSQILKQLALHSDIQTRELETVANLKKDDFNATLSDLVKFNLIRNTKGNIIPTEKFRKTYELIKNDVVKDFPTTVNEDLMKKEQEVPWDDLA